LAAYDPVVSTIAFWHDVPYRWNHLSPQLLSGLSSIARARGWTVRNHESAQSLIDNPVDGMVLIDSGSGRLTSSDFIVTNATPTFAIMENGSAVDIIAGLGRVLHGADSIRPGAQGLTESTVAQLFTTWLDAIAPPSNGARIFLSYVHEDVRTVSTIAERLESCGFPVWFDRQALDPGMRWKHVIKSAICDGAAMIACFSTTSTGRVRSYMNEELTLAVEEIRARPSDRVWFIPARLDDCSVPDRLIGGGETLQDLQVVDLFPDLDQGIQRLVRSLNARRGPDEALSAAPRND
jgi:hypothetical protein